MPTTPGTEGRLALERVRGWMFDVDGCLVRTGRAGGEGGRLFPGAAELLRTLRDAGHAVVCCTNASLRTPARYAAELRELGLPLPDDAVLTAGYATAYAVATRHPGETALVLGAEGVTGPMRELGVPLATVDDPPVGVVVVAAAQGYRTAEIAAACRAVDAGAAFYVPVLTPWFYGGEERVASATAVVAEGIAWLTGRRPEVAGKPSRNVMRLVLDRLRLTAEEVVVVGDSMEAEIAMAEAAGAQSVWVATGAPPDAPGGTGSWGSATPTVRVADVAELHAIVAQSVRRSS